MDSSCKDIAEKDSTEVNERINDVLPVPQLKVNADGEVIIDTDSLVSVNSVELDDFGIN